MPRCLLQSSAAVVLVLLPSVCATADATTSRLLSWILKNGGGANVRAGISNGLRGLVVERACAVGDVILEVPLSLAISDGGDSEPLAGAAPEWTWKLPWNVQLAVAVLERKRLGTDLDEADDPFLDSWPKTPPPLPTTCESAELALASDPSLEEKAGEAFFWLDEQYWVAREAAAASQGCSVEAVDFPEAPAFREAMELVWSRCLRITAGAHGVRRVLVPLLDLANHEACPSAMYAFASGARCAYRLCVRSVCAVCTVCAYANARPVSA